MAQTNEHDGELLRNDMPAVVVDANASLADVDEVNGMGSKIKQDQGETTRMTDYERSKMLRVPENQERLRELGIKKIANSLTSLVDSQKTKKTKKKSATISETNAMSSHDHNGETGKDYPQEVSASVGAPKKKVAEKAKANWAKKKMVQVTAKKSFARVREELKKCLTGNELTRKEVFRACFSKDTGLQKMSKLQMQLMERDDDA
ncbi:transposase, Ptta/En/Spm [Artemisia annua]|uniref:Transposase, Ptta/En/Spm n=1 Tax=Artemisia annua TaxID=35608 RepID=A0A2U1M7D2_ARTAN|nr:transposase, Ptta/En/Spm [Artemisia annua]